MDQDKCTIRLQVADHDDDDRLEAAVRALRRMLLESDDVLAASHTLTSAPNHTKSGEVLNLAELIVDVFQSKEAIAAVIGAISGWLAGREKRSVEITIDGDSLKILGGRNIRQQQAIEAWIARHGAQ